MEPRLIKQRHVEYIEAPWLGGNRSGWEPVGDYVLVQPDAIAMQTTGGIALPDDVGEREQMAASTGVIVECGEEAFKWNADRTRLFEGRKPKGGDRVIFEKYAGKVFRGEDGIMYRVLEDKNIGCIKRKA